MFLFLYTEKLYPDSMRKLIYWTKIPPKIHWPEA